MKRGLLFLISILIVSPLLTAISGVSPAYYEIDFKPNLEAEYIFSYLFDEGAKTEISISGDLSEYVKVIKEENILKLRVITVKMELPSEIKVPGVHRIRIGLKEKPGKSGFSIIADVGGIIKVRVPYPGKYASISLTTEYVNTGEDMPYKLQVQNLGKEDLTIKPILQITNAEGIIESFTLDQQEIKSTEEYTHDEIIKTTAYKPGDYNLTVIVDYGGEEKAEAISLFRLGELKVQITNYTKSLERNKVGRFVTTVESLWNDPISEVYVTLDINGYPSKQITTPTISLQQWKTTVLNGFLDTNEIEEDIIYGTLTVHYDGHETSEEIGIIITEKINTIVVGAIIGTVLIIVLLIVIIFLLAKKKNGKK